MRPGRRVAAVARGLVLAVLAGGAAAPSLRADGPPAPVAPPAPPPAPPIGAAAAAAQAAALRAKTSLLKDRVSEWCRARQDLKIDCPNCQGKGSIAVGRLLRPCSKCEGLGKSVSKARFRQLHFDMLSPAYRRLETAVDAATAAYEAQVKDVRKLRNLGGYRIDALRLVDDTHAVANTTEDSVPRVSRWVYATDPNTKKTTWWFWREEGDGPWPEAESAPAPRPAAGGPPAPGATPAAPPVESPAPPAPRRIDERLRVAVVAALAAAKIEHTVESVGGDADVVIVTLSRGKALATRMWEKRTDPDVVAAARATFGVAEVRAVRVLVALPMRSSSGVVEARPRTSYDLTRETFASLDLRALSLADTIRRFTIGRVPLEGWTPVLDEPPPDSISLAQDKDAGTAVASAKAPHKLRLLGRYGDVLVIRLRLEPLPSADGEEASEAAAAPAAVRVARAVLERLRDWNGVRIEFVLPYRDGFGKVSERAHLVCSLPRAVFEKLAFDNLNDAEAYSHFDVEHPGGHDLVYWPK